MKFATLVHSVKGADLRELWVQAAQQNKTPVYVIHFGNGMKLVGALEFEMPGGSTDVE